MNDTKRDAVAVIFLTRREFTAKPTEKFPNEREFVNFLYFDLDQGICNDITVAKDTLQELGTMIEIQAGNSFKIYALEYDWKEYPNAMYKKLKSITDTGHIAKITSDLPSSIFQ